MNIIYLYLGAYTPVTMEGRILVDDILTSCYASVHHDLAHIGMTPIRWFPDVIAWIFGEMNEYVPYIKINEDLGRWVLPYKVTSGVINIYF